MRATRYWLAGAYEAEPPAGHVVVRSGDFVREVASHSSTRQPTLIVVPPDLRRLGSVATRLALVSRRRVLVARPPCRSRTILAASDLVTLGFPVLQEAARLVTVLRMALVSFHNFNPLAAGVDDDDKQRRPQRPTDATQRLNGALEGLSTPGAGAAIRTGVDASSAIVDEARDRQVDLVIVGVRQRSLLERWIFGSVPAKVAKRANCSVLIAPLAS